MFRLFSSRRQSDPDPRVAGIGRPNAAPAKNSDPKSSRIGWLGRWESVGRRARLLVPAAMVAPTSIAAILIIATLIAAAAVSSASAAPLDRGEVDAEAAWMVHLDVDALRDSQSVNRWIRPWLQSPAVRAKIDELDEQIGFDPTTDLHGVTLYGNKLIPNRGVVIMHGQADAERLHAFLREQPDYRTREYDGRELLSWTSRHRGQPHTVHASEASPGRMLFSRDKDDLTTALKVLAGQRPSLADTGPHPSKSPPGTMLTIRMRKLSQSRLGLKSPLFRLSETISFILGEHQGEAFIRGRIEARSGEHVDEFRDVAKGLLALARLLRADDDDLLQLLDEVQIHTADTAVEMHWSGQMEDVAKVVLREHLRKALSSRHRVNDNGSPKN